MLKSLLLVLCFAVLSGGSYSYPNNEGIQIYQKNLHLSPERKQNLEDDVDRYHNADNMWDVLTEEFTLQHYADRPEVQEQIEWFMSHPDFLIESTQRAVPYLYFILQQVRKRHLPAELVLLPMLESSYNPFAYSSAGAAGIWQMMPGTASGYGIKQNGWYDGRRDVIASTRAALNHLLYLNNFFGGNWLLVLAAYNSGEGRVLSAIKKNIREGESTDFWSLPLPQQTREYVPRLLALATILSHPDEYPIHFPPVHNAPYLAQIDLASSIDLKNAAVLAGITLKKIKQLNPGYRHTGIDHHGTFKLVLPIENVEQFSENLENSPGYAHEHAEESDDLSKQLAESKTPENVTEKNTSTLLLTENKNPEEPEKITHYSLQPGDTIYMIRKHDTIAKIAKRFHITEQTIELANNVNKHHRFSLGEKLIIPSKTDTAHQLSPGDTIYMVRRHDTIEKIAKKFHTTPSAIRLNNLIADNTLREGDRLMLPAKVG